jgi:cysteine desulfurase
VVKFLNVYLDYAATTPADERVVTRMTSCLGRDGIFANPSSGVHAFGFAAETAVEEGRAEIANNSQLPAL